MVHFGTKYFALNYLQNVITKVIIFSISAPSFTKVSVRLRCVTVLIVSQPQDVNCLITICILNILAFGTLVKSSVLLVRPFQNQLTLLRKIFTFRLPVLELGLLYLLRGLLDTIAMIRFSLDIEEFIPEIFQILE